MDEAVCKEDGNALDSDSVDEEDGTEVNYHDKGCISVLELLQEAPNILKITSQRDRHYNSG